jgi:hypothetical protein
LWSLVNVLWMQFTFISSSFSISIEISRKFICYWVRKNLFIRATDFIIFHSQWRQKGFWIYQINSQCCCLALWVSFLIWNESIFFMIHTQRKKNKLVSLKNYLFVAPVHFSYPLFHPFLFFLLYFTNTSIWNFTLLRKCVFLQTWMHLKMLSEYK